MTLQKIIFQGQVARHFASFATNEISLAKAEARSSCKTLPVSEMKSKVLQIAKQHLVELNKTIQSQKDSFNPPFDETVTQRLMKKFIADAKASNTKLFNAFAEEMLAELFPSSPPLDPLSIKA